MRKLFHLRTLILSFLPVLIGVSALPAVTVFAKAEAQGLEISPVTIEIETTPGEHIEKTITLRNVTSRGYTATPEVHDFVAGKDEAGTPVIDTRDENHSNYSFRKWVAPIAPFHLSPREG